jgi:hypothetical protein
MKLLCDMLIDNVMLFSREEAIYNLVPRPSVLIADKHAACGMEWRETYDTVLCPIRTFDKKPECTSQSSGGEGSAIHRLSRYGEQ